MHGVEIRLDYNCLKYHDRYYDISFGECPCDSESDEYAAWSIGRKFYFDFTVCGFISINDRMEYGGNVHRRPEILEDIDSLLRTHFSYEWERSHSPYSVTFLVPLQDIVYNGWDTGTEEDMVMHYLYDAYMCVVNGPDTMEVLCKNGVEIRPEQIIECKKFTKWL